ncbi:hypothetical protein A1F94_008748 [Pyrenophora tritici-repentis]|nr:hypothetical protein A1F94_008748 [Pyrenophora tritici-repentis]
MAEQPRSAMKMTTDHRFWGLNATKRGSAAGPLQDGKGTHGPTREAQAGVRSTYILPTVLLLNLTVSTRARKSFLRRITVEAAPFHTRIYRNQDAHLFDLQRDGWTDDDSDRGWSRDSDDEDSDYIRQVDPMFTKRGRDHVIKNDTELFCLMKALEDNDSEINRVAAVCADIQLSSLSAIIIEHLPPRELRDQILGYLWTKKRVRDMDESLSSSPRKKHLGQTSMEMPEILVPQFANAAVVGAEFASEAAALYFRTLIGAEIDYRCVRAHLERETVGTMPCSVAKTIRRLTVKIEEGYIGWVIDYEALKDCMQSLLMLKDRGGMCIEIYLNSSIQYSGALFRVLETIRPFYLALRDTKVKIKVFGYNFFSLLEDESDDVFSEQLNYYFMGTPEEWLKMKKMENQEILEAPLRNHCKRTVKIMRKNLEFYDAFVRRVALVDNAWLVCHGPQRFNATA